MSDDGDANYTEVFKLGKTLAGSPCKEALEKLEEDLRILGPRGVTLYQAKITAFVNFVTALIGLQALLNKDDNIESADNQNEKLKEFIEYTLKITFTQKALVDAVYAELFDAKQNDIVAFLTEMTSFVTDATMLFDIFLKTNQLDLGISSKLNVLHDAFMQGHRWHRRRHFSLYALVVSLLTAVVAVLFAHVPPLVNWSHALAASITSGVVSGMGGLAAAVGFYRPGPRPPEKRSARIYAQLSEFSQGVKCFEENLVKLHKPPTAA